MMTMTHTKIDDDYMALTIIDDDYDPYNNR